MQEDENDSSEDKNHELDQNDTGSPDQPDHAVARMRTLLMMTMGDIADADESENEDENDASKDEDHKLDQNNAGSPDQPDHAGARDENSPHDGRHCRVLRQRRKPVPVPGSQSMTLPTPNSTIKPRYGSMKGKYTFDSVTKKYSCRICHKEFSTPSNVGQHINAVHEGRRHPCASCEKTYRRPKICRSILRNHTR